MRGVDLAIVASIPDNSAVNPTIIYQGTTVVVQNNLNRQPRAGGTYATGEIAGEAKDRFEEIRTLYAKVLDERDAHAKALGDKHDAVVASAMADKQKADDSATSSKKHADEIAETAFGDDIRNAQKNRDIGLKRAEACRDKPREYNQAIRDLIELYRKETFAAGERERRP